ncbi:MAG: cyclic nucleotide-binding domain-containing protein [Deltaproteobacteria bacterium]|nr:cyclic nucleotide-binding domain-containing protein [Deltaproteobacteria bacterium]
MAIEGLDQVAAITTQRELRTGTYVFREGDLGDKLYIVLQGKVRISRTVPGMGEEALAILGPGEAFGEMSLIDDFPRSADALVHESCQLAEISRESLEELLFLNKDLAFEILWNFVKILSSRLRETNEKMTFLSITGKF